MRRFITTFSVIFTEAAVRTGSAAAILHPRHHPTQSSVQRRSRRDSSVALFVDSANSTSVVEVQSQSSSYNKNNVLTFRSIFETESKALPMRDLPLKEYFDDPKHISFGKTLPSRVIPSTPELLEQWVAACRRVGASLPRSEDSNSQDVILSVRTAGISLPGLKLEWSALIGARVVDKGDDDNLPELELVLIRDETTARGAKPMMWVYNKMNNVQKIPPFSSPPATGRDTTFLTRLGFHRSEEEKIIFRCSGYMEMNCRMSPAVRRLVGSDDTKKRSTEKRVSDLITRQIEKDMTQSIRHWEENFRVWAREHETCNPKNS